MGEPEPFLSLGFAAISWIEHYLVHGPGDVQGQPIDLDDEYAAFVVKAYRVDAKTGVRKVRRAFLSRAKGRAKSELAAMIACFEALGPARFDHWAEVGEVSDWGYEYEEGEPVGAPLTYVEILNVATEEGQAGNTYDNINYMLGEETCSAELLADFGRLDVGLTRINLPDKRGSMEPVTSADSSKDGGKSTFIVADETHLWVLARLKRLHSVMTRNLLKRKAASGWMLETSTMYADGEDSVAQGTHAYAKQATNDGKLLFDHVQAEEHWDLTVREQRIKALHESYGPAADWMDLDEIADSWDDPQASHAEWKRYWANQPVRLVAVVETTVIPADVWKDHVAKELPAQDTPPAALSLDRWHDGSTSIAGAWLNGESVHVELLAVDQTKDVAGVVEWLVERAGRKIPVLIAADSPAAAMAADLIARRVKVKLVNVPEFARSCQAFVDEAIDGPMTHAGQEQLDDALAGATKLPVGKAGAWVWDRRSPDIDISPLVAATLARFGLAGKRHRQHTGTSYQRR